MGGKREEGHCITPVRDWLCYLLVIYPFDSAAEGKNDHRLAKSRQKGFNCESIGPAYMDCFEQQDIERQDLKLGLTA